MREEKIVNFSTNFLKKIFLMLFVSIFMLLSHVSSSFANCAVDNTCDLAGFNNLTAGNNYSNEGLSQMSGNYTLSGAVYSNSADGGTNNGRTEISGGFIIESGWYHIGLGASTQISGSLEMQDGNYINNGSTDVGSDLSVGNGYSGGFQNGGQFDVGGDFNFNGTGSYVNDGVMNISNDLSMSSAGTYTNSGTTNLVNAVLSGSSTYTNSSGLSSMSGDLSVSSSYINSGGATNVTGGIIITGGDYTNSGGATSSDSLEMSSGSYENSSSTNITNVNITGGTYSNLLLVSNIASLTVSNGLYENISTTNISGDVIIHGVYANGIDGGSAPSQTDISGELNIGAGGYFYNYSGDSIIGGININEGGMGGVFEIDTGSAVINGDINVVDSGTGNPNTYRNVDGTVTINGDFSLDDYGINFGTTDVVGSLEIGDNGNYENRFGAETTAQSLTSSGTISNVGDMIIDTSISISGGTYTNIGLTESSSFSLSDSGHYENSGGTTNVDGDFNFSGGLYTGSGGDLNVDGNFIFEGGNLDFISGTISAEDFYLNSVANPILASSSIFDIESLYLEDYGSDIANLNDVGFGILNINSAINDSVIDGNGGAFNFTFNELNAGIGENINFDTFLSGSAVSGNINLASGSNLDIDEGIAYSGVVSHDSHTTLTDVFLNSGFSLFTDTGQSASTILTLENTTTNKDSDMSTTYYASRNLFYTSLNFGLGDFQFDEGVSLSNSGGQSLSLADNVEVSFLDFLSLASSGKILNVGENEDSGAVLYLVGGTNFENIDSVTNNGTIYLGVAPDDESGYTLPDTIDLGDNFENIANGTWFIGEEGAGQQVLSKGDLTLSGTTTNITLEASLTLENDLGELKSLTIGGGATLIAGDIALTGDELRINYAESYDDLDGNGVYEAGVDTLYDSNGNGFWDDAGYLETTSNTTLTFNSIYGDVVNDGVMIISGDFTGGFLGDGTWYIEDTATTSAGVHSTDGLTGTVHNDGIVNFERAGSETLKIGNLGVYNNSGETNIAGDLELDGGEYNNIGVDSITRISGNSEVENYTSGKWIFTLGSGGDNESHTIFMRNNEELSIGANGKLFLEDDGDIIISQLNIEQEILQNEGIIDIDGNLSLGVNGDTILNNKEGSIYSDEGDYLGESFPLFHVTGISDITEINNEGGLILLDSVDDIDETLEQKAIINSEGGIIMIGYEGDEISSDIQAGTIDKGSFDFADFTLDETPLLNIEGEDYNPATPVNLVLNEDINQFIEVAEGQLYVSGVLSIKDDTSLIVGDDTLDNNLSSYSGLFYERDAFVYTGGLTVDEGGVLAMNSDAFLFVDGEFTLDQDLIMNGSLYLNGEIIISDGSSISGDGSIYFGSNDSYVFSDKNEIVVGLKVETESDSSQGILNYVQTYDDSSSSQYTFYNNINFNIDDSETSILLGTESTPSIPNRRERYFSNTSNIVVKNDGILNIFVGNYDIAEDIDEDGNLDVAEDVDGDGVLDTVNEDIDGDGNLDVAEDINSNGILDAGEDIDGDGFLDLVAEDLDGDGNLDVIEDIDGDGNLDVEEDFNGNGELDIASINTSTYSDDKDDIIYLTSIDEDQDSSLYIKNNGEVNLYGGSAVIGLGDVTIAGKLNVENDTALHLGTLENFLNNSTEDTWYLGNDEINIDDFDISTATNGSKLKVITGGVNRFPKVDLGEIEVTTVEGRSGYVVTSNSINIESMSNLSDAVLGMNVNGALTQVTGLNFQGISTSDDVISILNSAFSAQSVAATAVLTNDNKIKFITDIGEDYYISLIETISGSSTSLIQDESNDFGVFGRDEGDDNIRKTINGDGELLVEIESGVSIESGGSLESNVEAVTDGSFGINYNGIQYIIEGLNFSGNNTGQQVVNAIKLKMDSIIIPEGDYNYVNILGEDLTPVELAEYDIDGSGDISLSEMVEVSLVDEKLSFKSLIGVIDRENLANLSLFDTSYTGSGTSLIKDPSSPEGILGEQKTTDVTGKANVDTEEEIAGIITTKSDLISVAEINMNYESVILVGELSEAVVSAEDTYKGLLDGTISFVGSSADASFANDLYEETSATIISGVEGPSNTVNKGGININNGGIFVSGNFNNYIEREETGNTIYESSHLYVGDSGAEDAYGDAYLYVNGDFTQNGSASELIVSSDGQVYIVGNMSINDGAFLIDSGGIVSLSEDLSFGNSGNQLFVNNGEINFLGGDGEFDVVEDKFNITKISGLPNFDGSGIYNFTRKELNPDPIDEQGYFELSLANNGGENNGNLNFENADLEWVISGDSISKTFVNNGTMNLLENSDIRFTFELDGNTDVNPLGYIELTTTDNSEFYIEKASSVSIGESEDINNNQILDVAEDIDGDGNLDIAEDIDGDGVLDTVNEDIDSDGNLDVAEDIDGDGNLDVAEDIDGDGNLDVAEDLNSNGILDAGEDIDGDGFLDLVAEDVDGDGNLDIAEDIDGDGNLDLVAEDVDGDGNLDVVEDVDGDGNLDVAEDLDGNGNLDVAEDRNSNGFMDGTGTFSFGTGNVTVRGKLFSYGTYGTEIWGGATEESDKNNFHINSGFVSLRNSIESKSNITIDQDGILAIGYLWDGESADSLKTSEALGYSTPLQMEISNNNLIEEGYLYLNGNLINGIEGTYTASFLEIGDGENTSISDPNSDSYLKVQGNFIQETNVSNVIIDEDGSMSVTEDLDLSYGSFTLKDEGGLYIGGHFIVGDENNNFTKETLGEIYLTGETARTTTDSERIEVLGINNFNHIWNFESSSTEDKLAHYLIYNPSGDITIDGDMTIGDGLAAGISYDVLFSPESGKVVNQQNLINNDKMIVEGNFLNNGDLENNGELIVNNFDNDISTINNGEITVEGNFNNVATFNNDNSTTSSILNVLGDFTNTGVFTNTETINLIGGNSNILATEILGISSLEGNWNILDGFVEVNEDISISSSGILSIEDGSTFSSNTGFEIVSGGTLNMAGGDLIINSTLLTSTDFDLGAFGAISAGNEANIMLSTSLGANVITEATNTINHNLVFNTDAESTLEAANAGVGITTESDITITESDILRVEAASGDLTTSVGSRLNIDGELIVESNLMNSSDMVMGENGKLSNTLGSITFIKDGQLRINYNNSNLVPEAVIEADIINFESLAEDVDGDGVLDTVNEDLDGDGNLDVAEDLNSNGILDAGEDIDGDGFLDLIAEDVDGDGNLDVVEDLNGNGLLDAGEDIGLYLNLDESVISSRDSNIFIMNGDSDITGVEDLQVSDNITESYYLVSLEQNDIRKDGVLDEGEDIDGDGNLDVNEDLDGDGNLDVAEDVDGDGVLDTVVEDLDGDGNLDVAEDIDGDGNLDVAEDLNSNGILDAGEDIDGDGFLDLVAEDVDGDGVLDLINEDIDGDGNLDVVEDIDGDGLLDLIAEDLDGDGNLDVAEDLDANQLSYRVAINSAAMSDDTTMSDNEIVMGDFFQAIEENRDTQTPTAEMDNIINGLLKSSDENDLANRYDMLNLRVFNSLEHIAENNASLFRDAILSNSDIYASINAPMSFLSKNKGYQKSGLYSFGNPWGTIVSNGYNGSVDAESAGYEGDFETSTNGAVLGYDFTRYGRKGRMFKVEKYGIAGSYLTSDSKETFSYNDAESYNLENASLGFSGYYTYLTPKANLKALGSYMTHTGSYERSVALNDGVEQVQGDTVGSTMDIYLEAGLPFSNFNPFIFTDVRSTTFKGYTESSNTDAELQVSDISYEDVIFGGGFSIFESFQGKGDMFDKLNLTFGVKYGVNTNSDESVYDVMFVGDDNDTTLSLDGNARIGNVMNTYLSADIIKDNLNYKLQYQIDKDDVGTGSSLMLKVLILN